MHTTLVNKRTSVLKNVKVGFSWTVLLFGFFPAIFRGDWKWALIIFISAAAVSAVTMGYGGIIASIVFAFIYNKLYVTDLLSNGFEPVDSGAAQILATKGYIQSTQTLN